MAGDELDTLVLLGLGVDELSMHALSIPRIKRLLSHASLAEARKLVEGVLCMGTADEVHRAVETYMRERHPAVLDPVEFGA